MRIHFALTVPRLAEASFLPEGYNWRMPLETISRTRGLNNLPIFLALNMLTYLLLTTDGIIDFLILLSLPDSWIKAT